MNRRFENHKDGNTFLNKLLTAVAALAVIGQMYVGRLAMANDLIEDAMIVRKTDKSASVDISGLASQYILLGSQQKEVEGYLVGLGFKVTPLPITDPTSRTLVAIRKENKMNPTGFGDELRIVVEFVDGVVRSVSGKIIYRAL